MQNISFFFSLQYSIHLIYAYFTVSCSSIMFKLISFTQQNLMLKKSKNHEIDIETKLQKYA